MAETIDENLVTIDTIISWFKKSVEEKIPISPARYLDASSKLMILLSDLDDELLKAKFEYERLERKRTRIMEFIRISKKRTELREWE